MTKLHASLHLSLALALGATGLLWGAASARADEPDVRNVRPAVMLLVDTSGSMEYALNARSGTIAGRVADCSRGERDRWISLLEVLTGEIDDYSCTSEDRRALYVGAPDERYPLHFARPRSHGVFYGQPGFHQQAGILDTYLERVKFGLMVFDNIYGLRTAVSEEETMMPQTAFLARLADSAGALGDYSYGPDRLLSFPGCTTDYMVNGGARREGVPTNAGGALVSYGIDDAADPNLFRTINGVIQDRLLTTRPYGGTPTAALLQDYEYYLDNHPDAAPPSTTGARDRLAACRPQYAILISDGQPSDPFRSIMNCDATSGGASFHCPYDRPADIVSRLCSVGADGQCTSSRFRGLFAVLFQPGTATDADVAQATTAMNQIAAAGGTCATPGACAYLATDAASLAAAIGAALDRASPGTRTRTTPAFGSVSIAGGTGLGQYEVTSGFLVGDTTRPWSGVLNRQRWECDGTTPVARTIEARDRFATTLNGQATRTLRTVVPSTVTQLSGIVVGPTAASYPGLSTPTGSTPRTTVATMTPFAVTSSTITPAMLGITGFSALSDRTRVINWVRAEAGSGREAHRMGDIYHSQPVIVGPPTGDIADESYNLFTRRVDVAQRPPMVYFGTNDGIIHAVVLADHTVTSTSTTFTEGQELWGFIPPALLPKLESARVSHQFLADGPPIVRDVFFQRRPGDAPSDDQYHTVLLMGLRQGGTQYVALDVTDPQNPVFLWQWTHDDMGATYGRPGLAQALVDLGDGPEERAVAILPGGMGNRAPGDCALDASNRAPRSVGQTRSARTNTSCWSGNAGRSFHVVDVATGHAIRSWTAADIQVPFSGAVSLFTGQTGSITTRAYTVNADGVLWRLDLSSSDPSEWTFRPFHDLYWNDGPLAGHTSSDSPVISIDNEHRPVIIVGTGDPENFETPGINYVVSLVEEATATPYVAEAEINWEVRLHDQEMVTGPIELFDGRVYFGTFASGQTAADACSFGSSRLWGVDFMGGGTTPTGYPTPGSSRSPGFGWESAADAGSATFTSHYTDLGANQIVMGVGVTQRPTCVQGSTIADPYTGPRYDIDQIGGGEFELVAQVSSDSEVASGSPAEVATIRRTLPAPISYTRTIGSASVDF